MYSKKKFYYKGVEVNALGIPTFLLGNEKKDRIKINAREKDYYNTSFFSPFSKTSPKNMIVMYDIPSDKKKERDWFRRQLKKFNYIMIQKSVWVGPSPLPKEFIDYVKKIGLKDNLKTFKLATNYQGKDNNL